MVIRIGKKTITVVIFNYYFLSQSVYFKFIINFVPLIKTYAMEYEIMIFETSHVTFNVGKADIYKEFGDNVIGALVVKTEDLDEKHPNPKTKASEFEELYYKRMLDASIYFSDTKMKEFLQKYDSNITDMSEKHNTDWQSNKGLLKKYTGIKLLVEQISVVDFDDIHSDNKDYDTENDLFNPEYYEPDDWEFILRVKKVL